MRYEPIPGEAHSPSDEETMSVIRSVLTEAHEPSRGRKITRAERKAAARAGGAQAGKNGTKARALLERTLEPDPRRRAGDLPELSAVEDKVVKAKKRRLAGVSLPFSSLIAKLRGFRPSVRLIALLSIALLFVLRPHWFVITGILLFVVVFGSFFVFGSDRIWGAVLALLDRVEARSPKRADRMRDGLDNFACWWDSILDRFPEHMAEAFYMPDLQAMKDASDAYSASLDERLDRMAHGG